MAIYQQDKIIRDVRRIIDRNANSHTLELIGDVDTLSLDVIIAGNAESGVKMAETDAPFYLLDGGFNFSDSIFWEDETSGWILLPEDFMRLIAFQMSDWDNAVYEAISCDDPNYIIQRSKIKGVRGTPERPVCAIGFRPEGRVLEFYSTKDNTAYAMRANYLPYPKFDRDKGLYICERCYTSALYNIAGLTLTTIGDENAKLFFELSKTQLI